MVISNLNKAMVIGVLVVICLSCKSTAPLDVEHHTRITFGQLGGIAKVYEEYRILEDGTTFKKTKHGEDFEVSELISDDNVAQISNVLEELVSQGVSVNDPGTITYFIKWTYNGREHLELIWGGERTELDPRVKILYRNMKSFFSSKGVVR